MSILTSKHLQCQQYNVNTIKNCLLNYISSINIVDLILLYDTIYTEEDEDIQNHIDFILQEEFKLIEGYIRRPAVWDTDYLDPQICSTYNPIPQLVFDAEDHLQIFSSAYPELGETYTDQTIYYSRTYQNLVLEPNTGPSLWSFTCLKLKSGDIHCCCYLCLQEQGNKTALKYSATIYYDIDINEFTETQDFY